MTEDFFRWVREQTILAIYSDEALIEALVLKGGNLLDLVYGVIPRSSVDLDFSIQEDFKGGDLEVYGRLDSALRKHFSAQGYVVFDLKVALKPEALTDDLKAFWGGYQIEFKIIEHEGFEQKQGDLSALQRGATVVGPSQQKKFKIDISRFEYCESRGKREFLGLIIPVYTPAMVTFEKLRAICQQMPEYIQVTKGNPRQRARDFVDIYFIDQGFRIDYVSSENQLLKDSIFSAKKVPVELLKKVSVHREFHRQGFPSVLVTVGSDVELKEFDFYFDHVLKICEKLF